MRVEEALDLVAARVAEKDLGPVRRPLDGVGTARAILLVVGDPFLRSDHRARIYDDLLANRDLLVQRDDPRLVDLIYWGEHVEALTARNKHGRLTTFHYVRALEVTCRRCGFELLPVLGRMEELGHAWSRRDYRATLALFLADVVELEASGETAPELGA